MVIYLGAPTRGHVSFRYQKALHAFKNNNDLKFNEA